MEDQKYFRLLNHLKKKRQNEQEDTKFRQWAQQFEERQNHIYKGERRVIPRYEVAWIISMFHDDPTMAHQSKDTTYQHIAKRYVWETMWKDVADYVRTCYECQQRGTLKQNNIKRTI